MLLDDVFPILIHDLQVIDSMDVFQHMSIVVMMFG